MVRAMTKFDEWARSERLRNAAIQARLAEAGITISLAQISRLRTGKAGASLVTACAISRMTGGAVRPEDFLLPLLAK